MDGAEGAVTAVLALEGRSGGVLLFSCRFGFLLGRRSGRVSGVAG